MPAVSPTKLVDAVLRAIQKSGGTGFYMSEKLVTHPREFLIQYGEDTISLWVYIWTLTPGGRPSLPNEYRVQMTTVSSPLSINQNGHTVLMGYHAEKGAYDNSLIYLDTRYYMRLNEQKVDELKSQRLEGGLDDLSGYLDSQIHLPANRADWPDLGLIGRANKLRRIKGYY